ncbi:abscisic acid 8'-hydroxylase 4-like isoform X2 [Phragmites australis]|uniref:abscisic acid 8'-hydroxylase 4-like isoform X2 n=1 Tax=Phragmites australis TaxID=29695 RepID=UPI002D79809C|nr:abscisic acid 8'-hydroxylase 4-like isoform X2 [Phragmites australis]
MMEMHRFEAAACQSPPPPPDAGAPFIGLSSFAACLLVAASIIIIIISNKVLLPLVNKTRTIVSVSKAAPPPPPGRGSSSSCCWWWWTVVETLSFVAANSSGRGFYHFVHARHLRYGPPCFSTTLFGHTHVFVSSPQAARSLLSAEADPAACFSKRYVRTVADLLGEHSLLCASHARHRSLRRVVAPLFNPQSTASFAATFDTLTRHLMRDWKSSASVAVVLDAALRITFEAICNMLISTLRHDTKRQLQSDVLAVTQAMLAFPLRLPGTRFYKGLQARKRIMDVLRQEIACRRSSDGSQQKNCKDFLQSLLLMRSQPSDSAGSGDDSEEAALLKDEQILDNILTLIIAGQATTATAITWMVKYLADNRDFQETLRSVQLEMAPKHQDSPLTLQHLNSMDFAYKAVKESLRMATIVSWFPRVALQDCQVAGFHIKKGWIVNVDARSLHYDPAIYDNPTVFDPWRFNEDIKPYSFLVFGAGGRTCLGMNLAKIMMLIFLHRLVTTFRWEMADDDPSLEKGAMFPRLKNGCPIHLTPI